MTEARDRLRYVQPGKEIIVRVSGHGQAIGKTVVANAIVELLTGQGITVIYENGPARGLRNRLGRIAKPDVRTVIVEDHE